MKILPLFVRHKQIAIGSLASIFVRGVQTITVLIITALATRTFSKEEFGLWAILLSFLYIGYAFDFGFRSALTNRLTAMVADTAGKQNRNQRDFYLSIFYLQIAIGIIGSILFITVGPLISWGSYLKIQQQDILGYINYLVTFVFVILFLNVGFLCSSSGFLAFQEVHIDALLNAIQWIILMGVFWFCVSFKSLPFEYVVLSYFLIYFLIGFIRTIILFRHRTWKIVWIPVSEQIKNIKEISSVSLHFFLLNISALTISTANTFLAGLVGGLSNAGKFNLIQRLFTVLITIHLASMAAFGPAFTHDARTGNWNGVRRKLNFNLYIIVPLLFGLIGGVVFIFHPFILKIWTGLDLANFKLTAFFALYALVMGWANTNSVLLNSLGIVKEQALWTFSIAPVFLFLTFYFGKSMGVEGVALAGLISAIPGMIYFTYYTRKVIRLKRINV